MSSISPRNTYPAFWKRALADLIDAAIMSIFSNLFIYLIVGNVGSDIAQRGIAWMFTSGIFVYWAIWESSALQASPGKWIMRLRIQSDTAQQTDALQAIFRNAAKFVSIAAVFGGILAILLSPQRKAWHDGWSKTQVVNR